VVGFKDNILIACNNQPVIIMTNIASEDINFEKLFSEFYIIPDYQREYVWGEKEVNEFIEDIYEEFTNKNQGLDSEYFIGSIIVCRRSENVYEVIDGQQRLTTAYLLLCAIRDYLNATYPQETIDALKNKIVYHVTDAQGNDQFRHRVELQYEESRGILARIALKQDYSDITATRSVTNIKNAYQEIWQFCQREFTDQVQATAILKKFYAYFIKNVKLIRVKTSSVAHALKIYATLNHRGLPLDDMDLLKNLMFAKAKQSDYDRMKVKWKEMIDLIFQAQERPMRFLRYFILSQYAEDHEYVAEDDVYEWFVKNESKCQYQSEPIVFVNSLLKSARHYVQFLQGKNPDGSPNRYLGNIRCLSLNVRQHLILLLAASHLPNQLLIKLSQHLENILFIAMMTNEKNKKTFDGMILKWSNILRSIRSEAEFDKFIQEFILPGKQKIADKFVKNFQKLHQAALPAYQMKYILAKFTQHIDEAAWGSGGGIDDLTNYILRLEIEYILPENPAPEIVEKFDKPTEIDNYIRRLGNLTLMEKSLKNVVGNLSFHEKKLGYTKSKFLLTRTIAEKVSVAANTPVDLAVKDLLTFTEWNSQSIEERQQMLTNLAKSIWQIAD
jgi:hypothetical protein